MGKSPRGSPLQERNALALSFLFRVEQGVLLWRQRIMNLRQAISCLGLLASFWVARAEDSFAERLGWQPDQVVVILHCNDAGTIQGANRGVNLALTKGVASSYSIAMPCPWVSAFVKMRPPEPLDIGIEVTLTSEFDHFRWGPLAGKAAVPGLVDPEGCFWKTVPQVAAKATPDEVEKEIRAQIERAEGFELKLIHIDTHDGAIYAKPEYYERFIKIALEKGIAPVIAGGHMTILNEERKNVAPLMKSKAVDVWNAGFPVIDDMHSTVEKWELGQKKSKLEALLHNLKPGITQIIFHPAVPTDDLRLLINNAGSRIQDNMILSDPSVRHVIENRKIVVTDWRELRERRKKAQAIPK
jgi:chitin disaccharide deacetylase